MNEPTIEEQISALRTGGIINRHAILASLEKLAAIRSAELPVEPGFLPTMRKLADKNLSGSEDAILIRYIDALKAFALKEKERAEDWENKAGQYMDERDKAEAELAALRGRMMDLDAKDWLDTLADADKAMTAVALKEGK